jgi:hypothetical protein
MNFKVDENLPAEIKVDLIAAGHAADTVVDEGLAGVTDPELLRIVRVEQRVLLTLDKGIADVRAYPPHEYAGIILFRPPMSGRGATLEFVQRNLPALLASDLSGKLVVVASSGIRMR